VGTWHDPDLGRPIAAPLERCAELLGVDVATIQEAAANVEPYLRADGRTSCRDLSERACSADAALNRGERTCLVAGGSS
jgi:hypothetical protein